jgi:hypothetical protein
MPLDEPHDPPADRETPTDLTIEKPVPPDAAAAAPQPRKLTFLPAFRYVFDNPDWFLTVVFGGLCGFIPVLGQVAQMGFFYEIVEGLYRRPDAPYAKFDFRRFADYCERGVWVYVLAMLVGTVIYMFVFLPVQLTFQFSFIALVSNQSVLMVVMAILGPVILLGALLVMVGTNVLTSPLFLRAGLAQRFRPIFRFDWMKGFLKRVWVEEVLATLFIMASAALLLPLGCLVFCYGLYAAGMIVSIASAHMQWQIYEIYLERGGEPIPLVPLPAQEPPAGGDRNATEANQAGS